MNSDVLISVVVPTKNEEVTAEQFLSWCFEGFRKLGVHGEVIFLDSSTDKTKIIAQDCGARIVEVSMPGLGAAYRTGKGTPQGKWIIMGDADCTYDFRELAPFVEKLEAGYDFVIGNRFRGHISKGSMPKHHQYFGSPATSFIFKHGLGLPTGDIHCGMRAMTVDLYNSLPFLEDGWEYATEMIVSARNQGAKIIEIPISFYKEPEGRISHHKRSNWLSPFRAGWGTLRVTATYLIDRVFVIPGILLLGVSTLINFFSFIFSDFAIKTFRAGLLFQSILMFASSIGAFAVTSGLLARFAYRRELRSLILLGSDKTVVRLFTALVGATIIEIALTLTIFFEWLKSLSLNLNDLKYDYFLISGWLCFTSIFLCVLSVSIASLIGNHAQKFQKRPL